MKLLLLLSTTVFLVATGAEGLKCYNCVNSEDCSTEMTCTSPMDACVKTFSGEKDKYWVRLKGFYVVARFSAKFSENCSEADSGRPWGQQKGNSKPCKPFSPTQ